VYLYHFHNFEEVVVYDLVKELQKGRQSYAIPSLFSIQPFSETLFNQSGSQLGARDLIQTIEEKGIDQGIKKFWDMKKEYRTIYRYVFEEWLIKSIGLSFLSRSKVEEALEIFKLNCQLYPESWDVYYTLAEAYMKNGNKLIAIQNYEKALKHNFHNSNIQKILNKLKNEKK